MQINTIKLLTFFQVDEQLKQVKYANIVK